MSQLMLILARLPKLSNFQKSPMPFAFIKTVRRAQCPSVRPGGHGG